MKNTDPLIFMALMIPTVLVQVEAAKGSTSGLTHFFDVLSILFTVLGTFCSLLIPFTIVNINLLKL
ncbi:hypothetical protein BGU89_06115 [Clostridioides difficile]|nr:hypothetical protein BGU89_06115 [Clostridioides difficile]